MMKTLLPLTVLIVFLTGCNAVPPRLAVSEQVTLIPYQQVGDMQIMTTNLQARWGGRIISVDNRADSTVLDILHFELKASSEPKEADASAGRFRLYMDGFLDPAIYQPGRLVTALGVLGAKEQLNIGAYSQQLPTLYGKELYLWPVQNKIKETEVHYVPYIIRTPVYVPR